MNILTAFSNVKVFFLIGLLADLSASLSFALPPFRTEDAGTTRRGTFGLELQNEFTKTDRGNDNLTKLTLIYGLTDWIELDIDFPFLVLMPDRDQNEYGFGDTVVLSKLKILGEGGVIGGNKIFPDLALVPSILIPTGDEDKGLGSGEIESGFLLVVEETFWNLAGRGNVGYFATNDPASDEDFTDRFFYGVQMDFPLFSEKLRLGSEITGEFGQGEETPLFTLTGLVFQITDDIGLNGGVELGLKDAYSSVTVIFGLTFGFNLFETSD